MTQNLNPGQQEARDLAETIRRLSRQTTPKGRENVASIAYGQLKKLDALVATAAFVGQEALKLHDTVTAIREGEILVADGTTDQPLTLDQLKEDSE